jgi:excisionase family DNA binding protein
MLEVSILQLPESKFNELTSKLDRLEESQNRIFELATNGTLYTSEEVQKLLGVSQKTVQTYRDKGLIEFIQIGGLVRYSRKAVADFMERFSYKVKA